MQTRLQGSFCLIPANAVSILSLENVLRNCIDINSMGRLLRELWTTNGINFRQKVKMICHNVKNTLHLSKIKLYVKQIIITKQVQVNRLVSVNPYNNSRPYFVFYRLFNDGVQGKCIFNCR